MADVTVDSLEIEIEASSEKATEKLRALTDALKSLQAATKGKFGDIQRQIQGLGDSAGETPAVNRTRKKRAALDRATGRNKSESDFGDTVDLEALQAEYRKVGEAFDAALSKFERLKASKREIHKTRFLYPEEAKEINEAANEVDRLSDKYHELRKQIEAAKTGGATPGAKPRTADPWAEVKDKLKGSTLGDIIGDTGSIDEAVSKMEGLNDQVSLLQIKLDGLREKLAGAFEKGNLSQISTYTSQIQKLQGQIAELRSAPAQPQDSGVEQVESETSLQKKLGILQKIREAVAGIGAKGRSGLGSVDGLKNLLGKDLALQSLIPKGAASGVKALSEAFGGLQEKMLSVAAAHPILAAALGGVVIAVKTVGKGMKNLAQSGASALKKAFDLLVSGAKKLASDLKNLVSSGINKAVSGMKSLGKSVVSHITGPFTKAAEKISQWKKMLGSALFYSTVFRAMSLLSDGIKTGMDNLYQYSRLVGTQFAPAMNQLATSALYLKNSVGAMAAPLVQALAPAVDFLIDKFVALINVIGKAFAMLTGKSVYTQAKKHAVEYGDAANDAAKATQKFLLGIDELTILDNPAGGGGGAASDFGSMFEEVEIDQDQFDWVKQIRDAIKNSEWRSVGELVAGKLNEVVDSWNSYSWGQKLGGLINNGLNVAYGFLTKFNFENLGRKVADGLNGIFDEVEWDLLGRTFAAEWNALFDFIYGFATTLKWHEIGLDISRAINGFLDEIDPEKAATAFSTFITGLFTLIDTAIKDTKWETLGDKLAEFINKVRWYDIILGAFKVIKDGLSALKKTTDAFLEKWDWKDTAGQLSKAVNDSFNDATYFEGLGQTLGNAFTTAFNFVKTTIQRISWENIGHDIAAILNGIQWSELLSSVATTIAEAFNAVVTTVSTLVGDLHWEEVGTAVGNAINDLFDTYNFEAVVSGLENLVRGLITGLSTAIKKVEWDEVGRDIIAALKKVDWKGLLADLGTLIGDTIVAALDLFFSDPVGLLEIGADIVAGLLLGIGNALLGIGDWLKEHLVDPIVAGVKGLFGIHSPSTVMRDEVGANIVAGLLEGIKGGWDSVVEFFQNAFGPITDLIGKAWEKINGDTELKLVEMSTIADDTMSGMKTGIEEKLSETVGIVGKAWQDANTSTNTEWGNIQRNLNTGLIGINTDVNTQLDTVKTAITTAWENANRETFGAFETMKTNIHNKTGEIQTQATTDFKGVADNMRSPIEDVVKEAKSWGEDICNNLAAGMRGIAKGAVSAAANSLAKSISDRLHFSEPDVGPLSDFHTYMPDMLELMSKGIRDNSYKAVSAANELAGQMSEALGNIGPVEPRFSDLPTPQLAAGYDQGGNMTAASLSPQNGQGGRDMEIINALFAVGQQIVSAINENGDRPVNLDLAALSSATTSMQNRQNMMYGKTLQNY